MAEALLNHHGAGRFRAFSAGSHPKGDVHSLALDTLRRHQVPVGDPRSKSWAEFAAPGAPSMDIILTVCDDAAGEVCPVWPGRPATAHWGVADPASAPGSPDEQQRAFDRAYQSLARAVGKLVELDLDRLDPAGLKRALDQIGGVTS